MTNSLKSKYFPQLSNGIFADYGGSSPISQPSLDAIEQFSSNFSLFYPDKNGVVQAKVEIEQFTEELYEFFNTTKEEYSIHFFNNTTAAIRAVAYCFPWSRESSFFYQIDNHNSILGIRRVAQKHGVNIINGVEDVPSDNFKDHSLYAYPLQSNFNGKKYPKEHINIFQGYTKHDEGKFGHVLVDAAAYLPTSELNLTDFPADFLVFSLLKCFGCNSGVLLVRNTMKSFIKPIPQFPQDEISIIGARRGLAVRKVYERELKKTISQHVYDLAKRLHSELKCMKHANGLPVAELYPDVFPVYEEQGGVVAFNLYTNLEGSKLPHEAAFIAAMANSVFIRFGVHCNPGATYKSLDWESTQIKEAVKQHEAACSLTASIVNGKFVGSIRVSFGFPSTEEDVDELISFFRSHFAVPKREVYPLPTEFVLKRAFIYPIMGCQGIELFLDNKDDYRLVDTGLRYDNFWGIADELNTMLDRKKCPLLARVKLSIRENDLVISVPDHGDLSINLNETPKGTAFTSTTVCHEKINGEIYPQKVNQWLTDALGMKAVLVKLKPPDRNQKNRPPKKPFRLAFTASLEEVGVFSDDGIQQLRPHLIFNSEHPFVEDQLHGKKVIIGDMEFRCDRLIPANTDLMTSTTSSDFTFEPLKSITLLHSVYGDPCFGVYITPLFDVSRKNPKSLKYESTLTYQS